MKMRGSYYPYCSSARRSFVKGQVCSGVFEIKNGHLIFQAKLFLFIPIKKNSLSICLEEIDCVETMNLNGFLPFGVCLFMKDGKEYVLGHIRNKKLASLIEMAKNKKES